VVHGTEFVFWRGSQEMAVCNTNSHELSFLKNLPLAYNATLDFKSFFTPSSGSHSEAVLQAHLLCMNIHACPRPSAYISGKALIPVVQIFYVYVQIFNYRVGT